MSRGPSVALLYLAARHKTIPGSNHAEAELAFTKLYSAYAPKFGVRGFLQMHWSRYCSSS